MNDNEEKIYDLITSKSFDELSKNEKAFVLDNLGSKEAYAKMREANLAAMEAMAEDEPVPADLKSSVMEAYDEQEGKTRGVVWWKYAAAVAILAIGAFVFWPAGNPEKVQLAENVEREKPKTETEIQNENTVEESAEEINSKDATEEQVRQDQNLSEQAERVTIEEEMIVDESAYMEELTQDAEMAFEEEEMLAELDAPQMDEEGEHDNALIAEEEFEVQNFSESEPLRDDVAPPIQPAAVQNFSSAQALEQNATTMSKSMESKRSKLKASERSAGISLSQIGGPFPKAYVAY